MKRYVDTIHRFLSAIEHWKLTHYGKGQKHPYLAQLKRGSGLTHSQIRHLSKELEDRGIVRTYWKKKPSQRVFIDLTYKGQGLRTALEELMDYE